MGRGLSKDEKIHQPWGDLRTKAARWTFNRWLGKLDDASVFNKNDMSVRWYMSLTVGVRLKIKAKLREVDPQGLKELVRMQQAVTRKRNNRKAFVPPTIDIKATTVALRTRIEEIPGLNTIRFMDLGGMKSILALALAAGYSREETAAMGGIEQVDLNELVSPEDIKLAQKRMPDAVVLAADQFVMRDLLAGTVNENTERADRIADRRRKLVLNASGELREQRKEHEALQDKREDHLASRFGVDRRLKEPIEAEVIDESSESK